MTDKEMVESLRFAAAQLRHAYTHLFNESVSDQAEFAKGLIAPQIKRLEAIADLMEETEQT